MSEWKSKFLPNAANRWLFPGFVAFLVALFGAVICFIGFGLSLRVVSFLGVAIVAVNMLFGFWWGFRTFYRFFLQGGWKKEHKEYLESLKPKQPWQ